MELPALVSPHFWVICFLSCLSRSLGYWCFMAKQEGRQWSDLAIIQPAIIRECSVSVYASLGFYEWWLACVLLKTTCSLFFLKHKKKCRLLVVSFLKIFFFERFFIFKLKVFFFKPTARWAKDFLASPCVWCHCVFLRVKTVDADFILRSCSGSGYLGLVNWLNPFQSKRRPEEISQD